MSTPQTGIANRRHDAHCLCLLPYLRMGHPLQIAGVEFIPFKTEDGATTGSLAELEGQINVLLSSYVQPDGEPVSDCTVVRIVGKGWDLAEEDEALVRWATGLVFLAAWAKNEYFPKFGGPYVNSAIFRPVFHWFTGPSPVWATLVARRRDGRTLDGGSQHGEVRLAVPLHVVGRDCRAVDGDLLTALDSAYSAGSAVLGRLATSLPYVQLANSDDDAIEPLAEAILMGSAFEQLFNGDTTAYTLGKSFGLTFGRFGNVAVASVKAVRPGIKIDTSTSAIETAQLQWWVHRKWMEELHSVRSKAVHFGGIAQRAWGWALHEHLVMAAHVFPLAVKLLLEDEGHYAFNVEDSVRASMVDPVLTSRRWTVDSDDDEPHDRSWAEIRESLQITVTWRAAATAFLAKEAAGRDDAVTGSDSGEAG